MNSFAAYYDTGLHASTIDSAELLSFTFGSLIDIFFYKWCHISLFRYFVYSVIIL